MQLRGKLKGIEKNFKENYNDFLQNLPFINSPINITKIEVWITNKTGVTENSRNIISFLDLGESVESNLQDNVFTNVNPFSDYPDNEESNDLYGKLLTFPNIRDINETNNISKKLFFTAIDAFSKFI